MVSRSAVSFSLALALTGAATAQTHRIGGRAFGGAIDPTPASAALMASSCGVLSSFGASNPTPGGVTWDGTQIWVGNYFGALTLQRIDPLSGAVTRTIPAPGPYVGGLAWDGSALWACCEDQGLIYRVDPLNGNVLSTIHAPAFASSDPNSSDLAWDGQNLWHVDYSPAGLFKLDPANGNVLLSLPPPSPAPSGVSYSGGQLVVSDYSTDLIYVVDALNGNVLSSCPSPDSHPWGLEVTPSGSTWNAGANVNQLFQIDTNLVSTSTYCSAGTTTHGCVPSIAYAGTPSATAASGFTISVSSVEGQKSGILFYGIDNSGFTPMAWGSSTSYLCIKSPTQRSLPQNSGGTLNQCDGALSLDWNAFIAANPIALGNPFSPGDSVYAQGWFRDPPNPKHTMLSNGLHFIVGP